MWVGRNIVAKSQNNYLKMNAWLPSFIVNSNVRKLFENGKQI